MQVSKTTISPTKLSLTIIATPAELESLKRHVLGHFAADMKLPGFRAGKAPLAVVEKSANQQALHDQFLEHALSGLYRKAVESQDIRPVGQPNVSMKKFVPYTVLEFEVETEVIGQVSVPDYTKIKLPKAKISVTAADVKEVLDSLQMRLAGRSEVTRAAKVGDEVVIDFSAKDSRGEAITGAEGKDYPLLLGSNQFIPGFEDHLLGVKASKTKQFDIAFPKNYGVQALAGKKATFSVNVKKVSELQKPKVDDELAKKAGPFKTLAELKDDIKKQLKAQRQQEGQRAYEDELVRTITNKSTVDVPDFMVDEQVAIMEDEEKRNLAYRGQTWQEHLKAEGITEEQHRQRHRPQAEERVKGGLVLSEIAAREKLEVTPEELEVRLQLLKGQYQDGAMQAELDKPEARDQIAARLLTEKTIAKLVDYTTKN